MLPIPTILSQFNERLQKKEPYATIVKEVVIPNIMADSNHPQELTDFANLLMDCVKYQTDHWAELLDHAEACYKKAFEVMDQSNKMQVSSLVVNVANVQKYKGNWNESKRLLGRAIQICPENTAARFELSLVDLSLGNFSAGWANYEHRPNKPTLERGK